MRKGSRFSSAKSIKSSVRLNVMVCQVACSGTVLDVVQCDEFMSQNEVGNRSLFSLI